MDILHVISAFDVKKPGWRGVMRTLDEKSAVLVTNHNQPEAVILDVREYDRLGALAGQAESRTAVELDALRRSFDERLAALRSMQTAASRSTCSSATRRSARGEDPRRSCIAAM